MIITDRDRAERLLSNALGGKPELSAAQMADLLDLARDPEAEDGEDQWSAARLNSAVVTGWGWKAALTAPQYDLGAGSGKTLDRSQWFDHCHRMAAAYASGQLSVAGGRVRRGGLRSIQVFGSAGRNGSEPDPLEGVRVNG